MRYHTRMHFSPIDGKYFDKLKDLHGMTDSMVIFEKYKMMAKYLSWLLSSIGHIDDEKAKEIEGMPSLFINSKDGFEIFFKKIQNYDINFGNENMALIQVLQDELCRRGFAGMAPMVNFGISAEDITNVVHRVIIKNHVETVLIRQVGMLMSTLQDFWRSSFDSMMGMFEGQPSTQVSFQSVFIDFSNRLNTYNRLLCDSPLHGKMGGSAGTMTVHKTLLPDAVFSWDDWVRDFLKNIGLERTDVSAHNNPSDDLVQLFGVLTGLNGVLLDLSRDMWLYCMRGIVQMQRPKNFVSSTSMPHLKGPVSFEEAEGNLGISTALFQHMSRELAQSRMQGDLTHITIMKNFAVPFAHQYTAINSLIEGFLECRINPTAMAKEIENHPEVDSEIQLGKMKLAGEMEANKILSAKQDI